jgi:broad specificity phosphatase PhoE
MPITTVVTVLPNLREIDFHDWQDRDKTTLQQGFPNSLEAWKKGNPYGLVVQETIQKSSSGGDDNENGQDKELVMIEHRPLLELWERADQV